MFHPGVRMNRFFFSRSPASDTAEEARLPPQQATQEALKALVEVQSITASAIFAALVSKGVLTSREAADYMGEIAEALEIDVAAPVGSAAARMLRSYGYALTAAER